MRRSFLFFFVIVMALIGCRDSKKNNTNNNTTNNNNNTNNNSGDTIYMVQDPSNAHFVQDGDEVVLERKVVTAVDKYGSRTGSFWISEPNGGPWSGVQVYNTDTTSAWWTELQVGDLVTVHGRKMEYSYLDPNTNEPLFDDPLTEITEASVTRLGAGTPITPTDIDAADLKTVETGEKWEGVLVRFTNVRVSTIRERNGRLEVNLFGSTKAQDDLTDLTTVQPGVCLSRLTGVVTYFFDYYVIPRSAADIEVSANDSACPVLEDEICDDHIDNDGNGFTDCADFACVGSTACPTKMENDNTLCANHIDDDDDGLIDCQDPSCSGHPNVTVCTETNCTDNIDNNENGYTDCADWDCSNDSACANEFEQNCTDNADNDNDGYTDCADFNCSDDPACIETNCTDSNDNDGDTYVDCDDFDCLYTESTCATNKEITDETCSDGNDNDTNGFADCRDFSCQRSPLVTVCEGSAVTCADGLDNDGNGFVDCDDLACRYCHQTDPSKDRVVSTCPPCVH